MLSESRTAPREQSKASMPRKAAVLRRLVCANQPIERGREAGKMPSEAVAAVAANVYRGHTASIQSRRTMSEPERTPIRKKPMARSMPAATWSVQAG